ncbi:unnamed protein product [Hyaloperonospora brassicae]|uniref:DNA primase large subunit C-terminal domain-containing protein n=1 Tax=Hyaloperonospora brassicae TaxID=162125 RepID=A0AAV0UCQ1_HYABA|nr:unnamed protein product [Hyaloperonospora brassicae]
MSSAPYQYALSFYSAAPQQRVALDDFEKLGHKRVQLLSQLKYIRWGVRSTVKAEGPPVDSQLQDFPPHSTADQLSHYALRLAFCRDSSGWDWLVAAEAKLLAVRLEKLPPYAAVGLLSREGIRYELLNADDLKLDVTQRGVYRVPFTDAPTLVRCREVVLHDGFCFVPLGKMKAVAIHCFRRSMQRQLRDLQCTIPAQPLELERLVPMLDAFVATAHALNGSATAAYPRAAAHKLDAATVDQAAERHFPLCMKQLHRKLREHHHLKYDGRVQYRLFLKGAGFSVDECIAFFRSEFLQTIPAVKFDKEYTYHIRHSYGLEGSRKDYAPLDCERIIAGSAPGHGQYHGCPFKHWSPAALQTELRRQGLPRHTSTAIAEQAAAGHCQRACRALFEATHPASALCTQCTEPNGRQVANAAKVRTSRAEFMRHPNAYLAASMATLE